MKISLKRSFMCLCLSAVILVLFFSVSFLPKIPNSWQNNDIKHILKSLVYWQKFNLESRPVHPYNTSFPLTRQLLRSFELSHIGYYNNFLLYKMDNERDNIGNFDSQKQLETFLNFQPMMSLDERNILLYTLHVYLEVCKKFNLTYFVIEGTLLGTYRHMGLIPWDDDVDVIMDVTDWSKIRDVFSGMPDIELMVHSHFQWKIFPRAVNNSKGKHFKYPFLDIFFYDKDSTHIWGLTPATKPNILFNKNDIFPLVQRPFENQMVYVPNKIEKVVKSIFDVNRCVSSGYLHKRNMPCPTHLIKNVPCQYLYNLHPFVFQSLDPHSGKIIQQLKVGSRILKEFR
ncbi:hypothetical protein SNE40_011443 [Patella caerulea]|uniref:LicD/FKTN/FKRP nucleotidyltransferase domain-containing protein n=2 Tax=Patella caerulea TaxID=87958 RepID=A0AAN8PPC8_PATCE